VHAGKEDHLSQIYGAFYLDVADVSDIGNTLRVVNVDRVKETANTNESCAERDAGEHV
jgi:hypothetical protein